MRKFLKRIGVIKPSGKHRKHARHAKESNK